jgi:predicted ester cyclase
MTNADQDTIHDRPAGPVCPTQLVSAFYEVLWNNADETAASLILDPNLIFRGSLGYESHGIVGFLEYVRSVHAALANYRCTIDRLVATESEAAAKMVFSGCHRATFMGFEATGRQVEWNGAAFFRIVSGRIAEVWVIGDLDHLKAQLKSSQTEAG